MAAENCAMRKKCHPAPNGLTIWTRFIFRTKCDFLQVLDLHIFRQVARLLTPVPLPFSPFFYIHILFAKWQWILRRKMGKMVAGRFLYITSFRVSDVISTSLFSQEGNRKGLPSICLLRYSQRRTCLRQ